MEDKQTELFKMQQGLEVGSTLSKLCISCCPLNGFHLIHLEIHTLGEMNSHFFRLQPVHFEIYNSGAELEGGQ